MFSEDKDRQYVICFIFVAFRVFSPAVIGSIALPFFVPDLRMDVRFAPFSRSDDTEFNREEIRQIARDGILNRFPGDGWIQRRALVWYFVPDTGHQFCEEVRP